MALLDCLEGAPANTWLRTWSDREDSSSPLTFDEVWEQLEVRGSGLPEDHYHQMLKNFPSFSRLILHEVQDKRQRFWNLVEESEHSGEKFSSAELKNLIFDKIPSETAATLRNRQSEEKVKTCVSAASPICSDFQTFCPDWLHFGHFLCFGGIAASQLSLRIFPIYF